MKPLLFIPVLLLLFACEKAETDKYIIASKGKYAVFDNKTGCRIVLLIEYWGSGAEIYPNETYLEDSFRESDGQNILTFPDGTKRRFTVHSWVDNELLYTGWGYVQLHNDISKETLNQDYIIINH